jgi:hypothetical protein
MRVHLSVADIQTTDGIIVPSLRSPLESPPIRNTLAACAPGAIVKQPVLTRAYVRRELNSAGSGANRFVELVKVAGLSNG